MIHIIYMIYSVCVYIYRPGDQAPWKTATWCIILEAGPPRLTNGYHLTDAGRLHQGGAQLAELLLQNVKKTGIITGRGC